MKQANSKNMKLIQTFNATVNSWICISHTGQVLSYNLKNQRHRLGIYLFTLDMQPSDLVMVVKFASHNDLKSWPGLFSNQPLPPATDMCHLT